MDTLPPMKPSRVYLDVTNRCQLSCRHCCTSSGVPDADELTAAELLAVVDRVRGMGVPNLVISGGEPLLRPELPELLAHAVRSGLRVTVLTNGLSIDEHWAHRLAGWGVRVKISLDGATAATHDELRGTGTFVGVLASLRRLVAAGASDLAVHFTFHRKNLAELPEVPALLRSIGVRNLVIGTIKPSGRALANEELLIAPQMAPYVQQRVAALKGAEGIELQHLSDRGWEGFGCPAVCNKLGITATGRLTTCAFFGPEMLVPGPGAGRKGARRIDERSLLRTRLKQNPVFSGLPEAIRDRIADQAGFKTFARGAVIARELSSPDRFVLLLEGGVEICRSRDDGTRVVFRTLYPPAGGGYLLLSGQPHTADVVAAGPAQVALLPVAALRSVFDANPQLLYRTITRLAEFVDQLSEELMEQRTLPLVDRLRNAIYRNADRQGELRLSHEELAELVGSTRANVTRALKRLADAGTITTDRRVIRIVER